MPTPSTCTAGTIATPNPAHRTPTDTAGDTKDWLETNDYDSAPIYTDNTPIGYITIDTLQDAAEDTPLDDLYSPLTIDVIIAADAPLDTVLNALYDRRFYYLADRNNVTGILTRADLNTEPVYQHLYTHLSRLEHTLRDCIQTHAPNWQNTTPLNPDIIETIRSRHDEAAQADVALDPIHYAQFSTLTTIITAHEACWQALGYTNDHTASTHLHNIAELRNDVAHSTPLIQNTNRGLTETGRTITDLQEQHHHIQTLLNN